MAEWSNAAVLKTVDLNGSGGSNPSLSAKHKEKWRQVYLNAIFYLRDEIPESEGFLRASTVFNDTNDGCD